MKTPAGDRIGSLIEQLAHDARPVRPLWPPAARLLGWIAVAIGVGAIVTGVGLRAGIVARLTPGFLAELGSLGAASVAAAWIALRGVVPGLDDGSGRRVLAAAIVIAGTLGLVGTRLAFAPSLASFVQTGVHCAVATLVITLAPWGVLLWAIRRGAALRPGPTYAAAGLAASMWAYLLMRVRCPLDETSHIAVWHGIPVVLIVAASAIVGVMLRRSRRLTQSPL